MIVISPHLDDGVFSCGRALGAAHEGLLVTVAAGKPGVVLTAYDKACGFTSSAQAIEARRTEDSMASAILDVDTARLDILDGQYAPMEKTHVAARLVETIKDRPGPLLIPLGLGHDDHRIVSKAGLSLLDGRRECWLYEELPYRVVDPDEVIRRRAEIEDSGYVIGMSTPAPFGEVDLHVKEAAVACYRSQRLADWHSIFAPERFHPVVRAR